jgi:hypothetical protein
MGKKGDDIADIGPHGVRGTVVDPGELHGEVVNRGPHRGRQ